MGKSNVAANRVTTKIPHSAVAFSARFRHAQKPLLLLLLCALFPSLAGCLVDVKARAAPLLPVLTETPIIAQHQSRLVIEARLDISSSYFPSSAFDQALHQIADAIDELVEPNSGGATIYIGVISANSYQSSSIMQVINILPLQADPPQPILAKIACGDDPYQCAIREKQAQADYEQALMVWQTTLREQHRQLVVVKATVKKQTDRLRSLANRVSVDTVATDLSGALEAASEHFQGKQGTKYLIIASDLMQNTEAQNTGAVQLSGVRVKVINRTCTDAQVCESNDTYWRTLLLKAGAASVSITDPSNSQAGPILFS